MVSRLRNWLSIQKIQIAFSSQLPGIPTGLIRNAVFIDRSTVVKLSKRYFTAMKTWAPATSRSIRVIRQLFTVRYGNHAKARGRTACSMETTAAFSNRPMAVKPGCS